MYSPEAGLFVTVLFALEPIPPVSALLLLWQTQQKAAEVWAGIETSSQRFIPDSGSAMTLGMVHFSGPAGGTQGFLAYPGSVQLPVTRGSI